MELAIFNDLFFFFFLFFFFSFLGFSLESEAVI